MSSLPTAVKVLKYLMDTPGSSPYHDIIRVTQEGQAFVDRALTELVTRGLVHRRGENHYYYSSTTEVDESCRKLFTLYEKVTARPQKELLVRGLLSQPGPRYLWRVGKLLQVLEAEGFDREDARRFLDQETSRGYVNKIRIMFVARIPFTPPPFIPYYYMSDFRNVNAKEYEQLKEQCHNLGLSMGEEHYVTGAYPPELSQPAVHYVEKEKRQIRDTLREEAFRQWQGLTYSW